MAQPASAAPPSAEQLLDDVRAKYAGLSSYSDTGTMVVESKPIGAPMIREQLTFTTRFAAPKQFFFEATKTSGERFVIWCPGDHFHSWWSATQVHEAYSPGEGANAFAMGTLPTSGTALLIPPLLFQSAGLQGPLLMMQESRYDGAELLNGRRMHKITGKVRENHWNDSVRNTTLWIDAETLLVRKIFEDTPTGMGSAIQRATTILEPQLAPKSQRTSFEFRVPAGS
jgi:hypothetical protein